MECSLSLSNRQEQAHLQTHPSFLSSLKNLTAASHGPGTVLNAGWKKDKNVCPHAGKNNYIETLIDLSYTFLKIVISNLLNSIHDVFINSPTDGSISFPPTFFFFFALLLQTLLQYILCGHIGAPMQLSAS